MSRWLMLPTALFLYALFELFWFGLRQFRPGPPVQTYKLSRHGGRVLVIEDIK